MDLLFSCESKCDIKAALMNKIKSYTKPGLTTTAIGAVDLQGAGGNWATVGRRSRGGRRVRRQREKRKGKSVGLRIGTLNVGTMTGKGRELADMMERRKVDILCVQETRWKGSKARSIEAEFKLFYYGVDSKRNGVGVVLKEEFVRNVLEVKRVSDRVMSLKLEIEGVMLNVVSGYAPQVGCELEEKERFWSVLDEVMESIPTGERVVIGADFNGHVGEGNTGDEEVMGKFGVKERNLEGQMVVDFAKRMDMGVVNTYFQKREEHRVTYKSGGRRTQKKRSKIEKKTKWWKLKKEECCEEFREKLRQALGGQVVLPDDWETTAEVIRETGRKMLGVSSERRKEDKETWWWNEEVQDSIQRKRLAKKKWDMDRTEENRQEYKELQRRVKREVSKAKQKAYDELYTRLDTREGEKDLYRLARQRDRDAKDVQQKVDKIRKDEVRKALKRMKSGKAVGPDDIPVEVWKCLGEAAVEFLASLFNRVLENLEKAYDRVPREELWYCVRKSGVAEKYVRVVQDMYERSRTVVRCAVVMDQLSEEVRQESPWTMMFADDIVICSESREQVEVNLERWRFALERRGMKVSRIQSNGESGKEVKKRVQAETVSLRKRQESELEVAELKMLREARLRWFGHVQRRESEYIGRRMLDMELPGRRQRGRPKRSSLDIEKALSIRISISLESMPAQGTRVYDTLTRHHGVKVVTGASVKECSLAAGEVVGHANVVAASRMNSVVLFLNTIERATKLAGMGIKVHLHDPEQYKELQRRVKREVSKAKQKAYDELYTRLDTREGEKDLYRLARQRDRDGKDVQQVRVIKDRDGRVLTSEESVQRRWKEYFEELMNEENEREKRVEGVNSVEQKVDKIRKDEIRKALKRMKSGKAVGPDDIPVEVWKCLGEAAVEFLASLFNRVLENLEKAYDRVPREELWYCIRKSGVAEKYVRVVQDMYERSRTVVRCAVVMDQLSEEVRQESPWTMMFADDIVICSESREQVEENLERWRFALERRGMKVSRIQSNGECGKEVKKRVQAETVSLRKRQEAELEVAELKMLRFSLGVTRLDRIRNEYIRGTAHVGRLGDKVREARLRWFGHVQRREMRRLFRIQRATTTDALHWLLKEPLIHGACLDIAGSALTQSLLTFGVITLGHLVDLAGLA
ncbi:hypothetical protein QTP70_002503 [Hemibagrus guttatus]|uniref:Endonuclease/exonuclease/phosphatase domain-containing protein n=1 Tax=Hemibagrus guttatus TaxID=175788 RepID=A0AAE0UQG3_9TELE|nr:hypothetical protein QTP70_002503 [Hemibagrus guttatus]